jgi:uncharacterized protein (DUF488 family)
MTATRTAGSTRSLAELTHAFFGEALTMDEVFARVELVQFDAQGPTITSTQLWVGSVGYERYRDNSDFAQRLADAGVERLVDVRELPISRRRGYAKTALGEALRAVGIEYVHIKALGNPKPFRDLYKSGRAEEGRRRYERHLLSEGRDALDDLVPLLRDKRTALMCVEHDPSVCHRTVIVDALRDELQLDLDVAEIV